MHFSRIFLGILEFIHTYIQVSFMHVCKCLNQRVNRMETPLRVFQKQERKKKHMKRLSFVTQFKIEFLLAFTGCGKLLGKMPAKV